MPPKEGSGGASFGNVGFGGFVGMQSLADAEASALSPDAAQNLKRLLKRDATTKLKALAALREYVSGASPEHLGAFVSGWLFAYARLAGDASRAVRAAAATLCGELAVRGRRAVAPHARQLIALWYPASFDAEPDVAAAAATAFDAAFPGTKRREALAFAAAALRDAAAAALRLRTPSELPDPAATPEEGAERLSRAHACALCSLAALPEALGEGAAARAAAEATASLAADHGWLKPFITSPTADVRSAAFSVVTSLCRHSPEALGTPQVLRVLAPLTLAAALGERDARAQPDAFNATLSLCRAHGEAWVTASPTPGSKAPTLVSRLGALFRTAMYGNARGGAPFALPLLSLLPAELAARAGSDAPLPALLAALWDGRLGVPAGDAAARVAMDAAYGECAAYAVLRGRQAALDSGADADEADAHQVALLGSVLLERPLAALLQPASTSSAHTALASLFAGAAVRLSAKESLAHSARNALWGGVVQQAAAAAFERGSDGAQAVVALLDALHTRAGDAAAVLGDDWALRFFARPLTHALLAAGPMSGAPPSVLAVMAQIVARFGPAVSEGAADADAAPETKSAGGAAALIGACVSLAQRSAGSQRDEHTAMLVTLLTAPHGRSHWSSSLAALVHDETLMASTLAQLYGRKEAVSQPSWIDGWRDEQLDACVVAAARRLGDSGDQSAAALLRVALSPPRGCAGCIISASAAIEVMDALRRCLSQSGAGAQAAVAPTILLLQARWLDGAANRASLAAALYAVRMGTPPTSGDELASSSEDEGSDHDPGQPACGDGGFEARAADAWHRLCVAGNGLRALPAQEAAAVAVQCALQTRARAGSEPRWRERSEALAAASALMEVLDTLSDADAKEAALDALLAPAHGWPAWVAQVPNGCTAFDVTPLPDDWPRRMALLASSMATQLPRGALFSGLRRATGNEPPRRTWLAVELLCANEPRSVAAALEGSDDTDGEERRGLALSLLHAMLAQASADVAADATKRGVTLSSLRYALRLLLRCKMWDSATALPFFNAVLAAVGAAGGEAGVLIAVGAVPPLLSVLRSSTLGDAEGAVAAKQHTLAVVQAASATLRTRGARAPAAASLALRSAATCFPEASAGTTLSGSVTEAELDALCELWECVAAADATAAAAAAAARRYGGSDVGADAPLAGADDGIAAVALPLLRCAWHRLSRGDWALLAGRMRRWLGANEVAALVADSPPSASVFEAPALAVLPASACVLLSAAEALPLAVAEPGAASGRAAAGDIVPFSAAGAPALAAARAMAEAAWPTERGAVFQAALGAVFAVGALCVRDRAGAERALRADSPAAPFWLAVGALCERAPPGATLAAAQLADACSGGGAISALYGLLRAGDDGGCYDTDASAACLPLAALQRAAYVLLSGSALRTAAVLGLDAAVADVEQVLALADKAKADAAERDDAGSPTAGPSILAAGEVACLREPLAALLAAPSPPHSVAVLRAWALLLGTLLASPRGGSTAERLASYVRDAGHLPQLLCACADALPMLPRKALRLAGGTPGGMPSLPDAASEPWRAAAEPAPALATAMMLSVAALHGALFGAALRALPAESRAWFLQLRDARRAASLEACVAAWISPALVAAELDAVAPPRAAGGGAAAPSSGLSIRAARGSREVTASYSVDDALLEVTVRLPSAYPLRAPEAECARRVGVSEARLRKWLLSITAALRAAGGGVAGALALWGASVEREFAGVEPCPICYMTLHATSHALPRLACRQCRNRFHAACLYAWFTSSNKSACPICQTPWGTTVS